MDYLDLNSKSDFPGKHLEPIRSSNSIENINELKTEKSILISKYLPILDKLDKKILASKKIDQVKTLIFELERNIEQLLQKTTRIKEEIDELTNLNLKLQNYKKLNDNLHKYLPTNEEKMSIFAIESEMHEILKENFSEKTEFQGIFDKRVTPLLNQIKNLLTQSPNQFSFQAAASKGKALQAGIRAITELTENQPVVANSNVSKQEVFLLPEQSAVFKHLNIRSEEEERIVNDLLDLMSQQSYVGTFKMQKTSRKNFGIDIPEKVKDRGYPLNKLTHNLKNAIMHKVSLEDQNLIRTNVVNKDLKNNPDYSAYLELKDKIFFLKHPNEIPKPINFRELQELYFEGKLLPETLTGFEMENSVPMKIHIANEDNFFRALNYTPSQEDTNLYLVPDLKNPDIKKAYENCEQFKWFFTDSIGNKFDVDFKTLHANLLSNLKMPFVNCIPNKDGQLASLADYNKAINVNWKIFIPELMKTEKGVTSTLSNVQAKPFISDMILMWELNSSLREMLLNRLTLDSEFNAILTGEVQLYDMHSGNLGIAPEPTNEYERFKNLQFSTNIDPFKKENILQLILDYAEGKISEDTLITFTEDKTTTSKPLKELSELQNVLKGNWKLVIFDTDLSLSEDNQLMLFGTAGHIIPLRSVLLETEWKNKLLSKQTIDRLLESDERDLRVRHWIQKEDAQIYKQLSPVVRESIKKEIEPFINLFTLSESRKNNRITTINILQNDFVKFISHVDASTLSIWEKMEDDLSNVTIRPNDTWESIAKRHRQDVNVLMQMNPKELKPGEKIKIDYDLTSSSTEAIRKRAKISSQLFPRITKRQQHALIERQMHRKEYLNNYKALSESKLKGEEIFNQMENFIHNSTSPLTSIQRDEFLIQLQSQKIHLMANPRKMENLKQTICQVCQPTYFNLMKSMYPLLADVYALNFEYFQNNTEAGINIGLYTQTIENLIAHAKFYLPSILPDIRRQRIESLVTNLEKQINANKNPAIF